MNKNVNNKYQYKKDIPHVLENAGMFVGSDDKLNDIIRWVFNKKTNRLQLMKITYTPALEKIYDELLVNARDQHVRYPSKVTSIKINYDVKTGEISIYNNGPGIDIYLDKEFNIYSPELIFTKMRTSENYEKKKKTTGGKHGYGAKLTAVFSKKFTIETVDKTKKIKYVQICENNLSIIHPPKIIKNYKGEPYTKISFIPDYKRFEMKGLEPGIIKLFEKRAYDLAACTSDKVEISLNNTVIPINTLSDYVNLYLKDKTTGALHTKVIKKFNNRWKICVADNDYDKFMHVSFVNGINTYEGGTHVNYIMNQITKKIKEILTNKNKKFGGVTSTMIKNHIFLFVNAVIEDPEFPSQTKASLQTQSKKFGSTCIISDEFIKKIMETTDITRKISGLLLAKENLALEKNSGSKRARINIPKLEDANWAGTKKSKECVLILTEGDSAKTLAMSGLSVIKRDKYGIYPLRGKLMNVRTASNAQVAKNKELVDLTKILGLKYGKTYTSVKDLRYGHLLIMTDADIDGSHIKGLIINFIHNYWPSLTKLDQFIQVFLTPILKATKGTGKNKQVMEFYSESEYKNWKQSIETKKNEFGKWQIKYYKGLGTFNRIEAIGFFKKITDLVKTFKWNSIKDDKSIELAFDKKKANLRKLWVNKYDPDFVIDNSKTIISYDEFINKELIHFSTNDNIRSIPSLLDGLKPSQRKIMYTIFKKNIIRDIKVAQLSGIVSGLTEYHHGENSLCGTTINLAQNFTGSNNIELLEPSGQFGTRLKGGSDAAQSRYIFTYMGKLTPYIFHKNDFNIIRYLVEEGKSIEPIWYIPIIPMILCNGTIGIGTGYSTRIPNYNPLEVINNLKKKLAGKRMRPMKPWYRGFNGTIKKIKGNTGRFIVKGNYKIIRSGIVQITELPVGVWTDCYKEKFLENRLVVVDKDKGFIKKYTSDCNDIKVDYTLYLTGEAFRRMKYQKVDENGVDGFEKGLNLVSTITTTNMHLFNHENIIKKYNSPLKIIDDYFVIRLQYYHKRREYILKMLRIELKILQAKVKFLKLVLANKIVIAKRKKVNIIADIKKHNILPHPAENPYNEFEGYSYLLKMWLYDLTAEKIEELIKQFKEKKTIFDELRNTTKEGLWLEDLNQLEGRYTQYMKEYQESYL